MARRGHPVRDDSLWFADERRVRSADAGWLRSVGYRATATLDAIGAIARFSARRLSSAFRGTLEAVAWMRLVTRIPVATFASAFMAAAEAAREIRARLRAIEADRPASSPSLVRLGLTVAGGAHALGLAVLWSSGGVVPFIVAEGVLGSLSALIATGACVLVIRRERALAARLRREDEELAEVARSFRASDWRRRIGGF